MGEKVSFQGRLEQPVFRYSLAILASTAALFVRQLLDPILGHHYPFQPAWAAVIFSAWYCGLGPSIVTALIMLGGAWYWFMPSGGKLTALDATQISGMIGFLLFSAVVIWFGEAIRRSKEGQKGVEQALRASEAQLKKALQNMEERVRQRTAELDRKNSQLAEQARLLDLANDAILARTIDNKISYWNSGAERLYGWTQDEALGRSSHELLRTRSPLPMAEIAINDLWEGELLQTRRDGSQITVESRWTPLRDKYGNFSGWLEINKDITARKRAEDAARRLSGRILSLQDDERRRIARELHDSLGQYLVSLKLNVELLSRMVDDEQQRDLLTQCLDVAGQCLTETRTISHLLHPPLLDEAGFESAARWYVEGFAQRSAFHVEFEIPQELERLDRDVETALFRVLQEALTNVHRHSGGSQVRVRMQLHAEQVRLEISDDGKGIPQDRLRRFREDGSSAGVGLAGMRERVRELNGSLEIASSSVGTSITVTVPVSEANRRSIEQSGRGDADRGATAA